MSGGVDLNGVSADFGPFRAVDKATVDAADAWLADPTHPPALRRLVSEGRAGIVRALAAREFDSEA